MSNKEKNPEEYWNGVTLPDDATAVVISTNTLESKLFIQDSKDVRRVLSDHEALMMAVFVLMFESPQWCRSMVSWLEDFAAQGGDVSKATGFPVVPITRRHE